MAYPAHKGPFSFAPLKHHTSAFFGAYFAELRSGTTVVLPKKILTSKSKLLHWRNIVSFVSFFFVVLFLVMVQYEKYRKIPEIKPPPFEIVDGAQYRISYINKPFEYKRALECKNSCYLRNYTFSSNQKWTIRYVARLPLFTEN